MVNNPIIRIDQVNWGGQIFFEAAILFPDGRAASVFPSKTFEEVEKLAYQRIIDVLFFGHSACSSFAKGSGVVKSQIAEFNTEKAVVYCPIGIECEKMSDYFPCSNFQTCRKIELRGVRECHLEER